MNYRGYTGSVEFSEADGVFYGKVMGIRTLVSYEGETVGELVGDFHEAINATTPYFIRGCGNRD